MGALKHRGHLEEDVDRSHGRIKAVVLYQDGKKGRKRVMFIEEVLTITAHFSLNVKFIDGN